MIKAILRITGILILAGFLLIACYFFLFLTNTGVGLTEMFHNTVQGDPLVPQENEVVMPPNSTITATTDDGTVTIKSGSGLKRYYTWEGETRSVIMWPRRERWYGSLGIYYPGPGYHWKSVNGIKRCVVEEGQQHFDTLGSAMAWIKKHQYWPSVYNDSGLFITFNKSSDTLNVDVWQIYIGGAKPSKLFGSNNGVIATSWDD